MLRIFLVSLFIWSAISSTSEACAKVAVTIGHAVDHEGAKLKAGQNLSKGTEITTGPTSLVKLVLLDDSILDLGSSSRLKITACQGKNWETRINLEMKRGSIRALVNKNPKNKRETFELKTQTSILAVRGTEFFVSWQENQQGQVVEKIGVSEGLVEVRSLFDDAMRPISLTTGTELLAQGRIEKAGGEVKVEATAAPQVDQFTAEEQRQAEQKTKVENKVFENAVDLSGDSAGSDQKESKGAQRESDKTALFIKGSIERSNRLGREILSEKKGEPSSSGSEVSSNDPTSSGALDTGMVGNPISGPVIVSVPAVVKWGIQK